MVHPNGCTILLCETIRLVVVSADLEVSLWVLAHWAHSRSFFANNDVSAVRTFPHHVSIAREYEFALNVSEQFAIAFFVFFFDFAHHVKQSSNLSETFSASFFSKTSIHVGPLIVFACCRVKKIYCSFGNIVAMKKFKPDFSVFLFVVSCFFKDVCDLNKTFFASFRSIISVLVASHRFASKRFLQIFFCLRTF